MGHIDDSISGLKQIKELGIDAVIFGGDPWADPKIVTEAGEAAEGIMWATIPTPEAPTSVLAAMEEKRGSNEFPICSPQVYDATYILKEAMTGLNDINSEDIKDRLYETSYTGLLGPLSFDENGDLTQVNYAVFKVVDGEPIRQ